MGIEVGQSTTTQELPFLLVKTSDHLTGAAGLLPTLSFSGGGGSGAAGYVTITPGGVVSAVVITNPGSGYTTNPTASLTAPTLGAGSGATLGTVTRSGNTVASVPVTGGGSGYFGTVTIVKQGGAEITPSATIRDAGSGEYRLLGNATDNNTLGPLSIHVAANSTTVDPCCQLHQVVLYDPTVIQAVNATQIGGQTASAAGTVTFPGTISSLTAAAAATALWEDTIAGGDFATAGSIGKLLGNLQLDASGYAKLSNGTGTGQISLSSGTVTVGTNNDKTGYSLTTAPPTAAAIATTVWEDTIAGGDFATAGSIGKLLGNLQTDGSGYAKVSNGTGTGQISLSSGTVTVGTNNDKTGYSLTVTPPTSAAIATAIWEDLTTGSDFTTTNSIGALLKTYSAAPTPPTTAAIATAVWEDTLSGGDFATAGSIGKLLGNVQLDSSGYVKLSNGTGTGQVSLSSGTMTVGTNNDKTGYSLTVTPPTSAAIATAVWEDLLGGGDFGTSSSIGALLATYTAPSTPPTPAAIATAVWEDTLSGGDFATGGSIGKLLGTLQFDGSNYVKANAETVSDKTGYTLTVTPPTAAAIATVVWEDLTTGSDFTTTNSIGILLKTYSAPPTPPTAAAIASAVWQDTTSGDFTVGSSIGQFLKALPGAAAIATEVWQDLIGSGDFTTAGSIGALLVLAGQLLDADQIVDQTTTPWERKYLLKGTSTVLLAQKLYDDSAANVESTGQYVAQEIGI